MVWIPQVKYDASIEFLTTTVLSMKKNGPSHGVETGCSISRKYSTNLSSVTIAIAGLAAALGAPICNATELIYTPINPAFGGNPNNGPALLATASAQNKHKDPEEEARRNLNQTPLQNFNETLQRSVLSRIASAATGQVLDAGGRLIPGTVDSANFRISVNDIGGGSLEIVTTDKTTGVSTSFQVSQ